MKSWLQSASRQRRRLPGWMLSVVVGVVGVGLMLGLLLGLGEYKTARAKASGLQYATADCHRRAIYAKVCDSLQAESSDLEWGQADWIIQVHSSGEFMGRFSASMRVQLTGITPAVIAYSLDHSE